mmetsp:Transcript_119278/g.342717  ORF Transcript_119278/g.342717 Transcript_119278/m.342717 type:complete len:782 (-) Transcript_119278:138-2483(-)
MPQPPVLPPSLQPPPAPPPAPQTAPQELTPIRQQQVVRTLDELLQDRGLLKRCVVQSFDRARGSSTSLDDDGLRRFRYLLCWILNIPNDALGDLDSNLKFFDFDGNNVLDLQEIYRLAKFHLREYHKALGGKMEFVNVPRKTVAEAGYTIVRELGRGNQGIVKLGLAQDGSEVCIKLLDKKSTMTGALAELQEEFQALKDMTCNRIAKVFEMFQDDTTFYMVGEPYYGGDLLTLKARASAQGVHTTEQWYRDLFFVCFEALEFLHSMAVIHCDIKEPNIMLKTTDYAKPDIVLIDFGLSHAMAGKQTGCGGTPGYIPPETIESRRWFPRGDVFSMGVTLMQVVCDKSPPQGARTVQTPGGIFVEGCQGIRDIWKATREREPPWHLLPHMDGMERLLRSTLHKTMAQRATAAQVHRDPWFEQGRPELSQRPRGDTNITTQFLKEIREEGFLESPAQRPFGSFHEADASTVSPSSVESHGSPTGSRAMSSPRHHPQQAWGMSTAVHTPSFGAKALASPAFALQQMQPQHGSHGDGRTLFGGGSGSPMVQVETFGRMVSPLPIRAVHLVSPGDASRSPSCPRSSSPLGGRFVSVVPTAIQAPATGATSIVRQASAGARKVVLPVHGEVSRATWSPRMSSFTPTVRFRPEVQSGAMGQGAFGQAAFFSPPSHRRPEAVDPGSTDGGLSTPRVGGRLPTGTPLLPPPSSRDGLPLPLSEQPDLARLPSYPAPRRTPSPLSRPSSTKKMTFPANLYGAPVECMGEHRPLFGRETPPVIRFGTPGLHC